ncbi:MAG: DNA polymerase III subunit gamma/tau [Rhodospirillaceae bacterium]|nr:DNA polymerase III subunit gamma/tau [Rhodospirillaceae bacterium]MBT5658646.1 DNA polymerase III subunit gamma/tau [Rhodospirillaceae bacterium]MBT5751097.1 DNA polymerase III subunit gamma/tau [Rhodospirillaceae bacterium]
MTEQTQAAPYRVLARKYRPATFAELIGQEAMVRVLTNAIASGRLAHAFILTGVRGTGKTTTARIIARALNCIGADGAGGPTIEPCGICDPCQAIASDRHVDVIEMDAASRTGVDDIRELIDGVRYKPVSARYKIYIIDEVHMLSKNAFNALLKTLEEPPEHVKFIFATTEIRKVPVTVLSRCQRFDLRRIDMTELAAHLLRVAEKEGARITQGAAALIARAADGSVRDGLSLLDTAITEDGARVDEEQIRAMLGLADRTLVFDLMDGVMGGDAPRALALLEEMYDAGADPVVVLHDLLGLCHWLTRLKVLPDVAQAPDVPEAEAKRGLEMAQKLSMPVLARAWQMLLKGLGEVQNASSPLTAAEMVLVRLAYVADMPSPAEIIKTLDGGAGKPQAAPSSAAAPVPASGPGDATISSAAQVVTEPVAESPVESPVASRASGGGAAPAIKMALAPEPEPEPPSPAPQAALPGSFDEVVALAEHHQEVRLRASLVGDVHLVHFEPGRIEFRPGAHASAKLAGELARKLMEWTGTRWGVSISQEPGAPSLREQRAALETARREEAMGAPLVKTVIEAFPGAEIIRVEDKPTGGDTDGDTGGEAE